MNKKGIMWSRLITIILGLIVILSVFGNFITPIKNLVDRMEIFNKNETDIMTYNADQSTSAQKSTAALVCAVNVAAKGVIDFSVCPDGADVKGNKAYYGGTYVECSGGRSDYNSIELPKTKKEAADQIVEAAIKCSKKYQTYNEEKIKCAELHFPKTTTDVIPLESINKILEEKGDVGLEGIRFKTSTTITPGTQLYLCAEDAWWPLNDVMLTTNFVDCEPKKKDKDFNKEFTCNVNNFNLPQDTSNTEMFITGYGDPAHLVYYEAFPEEAAVYWKQSTFSSLLMRTIVVSTASGTINMIMGAGGGKLASEGAETAGKKITKNIVKETAEQLVKDVGENTVINYVNRYGLTNMLKAVPFEDALKKIPNVGDEAAEKITLRAFDTIGETFGSQVKHNFDALDLGKLIPNVEKNVRNALKESIDSGSIRISPSMIEELGEQAAKDATLASLEKKILKEIEIPIADGVVLRGLTSETGEGLLQSSIKSHQKELLSNIEKWQYIKGFIKTETKEVNEELVEDAIVNAAKRTSILERLSSLASQKAIAKSESIIQQIKTGTISEMKAGWELLEISFNSFRPSKIIREVPGRAIDWMINNPKKTAALFVASQLYADGLKEKFEPAGVNTVNLKSPQFYSESMPFELHPDVEKYYLRSALHKERPMYVVSPCKADITVKKTICDCIEKPGSGVFKWGDNWQNYKKGTLRLKPEKEIHKMIYDSKKASGMSDEEITDTMDQSIQTITKFYTQLEYHGNNYLKQNNPVSGFEKFADTSKTIKLCDAETSFAHSISNKLWYSGKGAFNLLRMDFTNPYPVEYRVNCMDVSIERKEGYCIDEFKFTENMRYALAATNIVVDVYINYAALGASVASGGSLAVPAFAVSRTGLFLTGAAFAAVDGYLASNQRWPSAS